MLLAQISDTHLLSDPGASAWGQNPAENLASVMHALPPVDVLVATGDIVDDGTIEAYQLADALTRRGAGRRSVIPGNHDDPATMAAVFGETEDWRLVELSKHWTLGLLNTQWIGHEAGCVTDRTLAGFGAGSIAPATHVVLALHHPPRSPCPQLDCGLIGGDRLLGCFGRPGARRAVGPCPPALRSERRRHRVAGVPVMFSQLRHGGDPHYTDTGEPPGAQILDLHDDGDFDRHIVLAEA